MSLCTTTRWISSPVEIVFTHLCDLRVYFEAIPYICLIDWVDTGPLVVGTTAMLRSGQRELRLQISACIENHLLELEITEGTCVTHERLALEPAMGGTRVTHTTESMTGPDPRGAYRLLPTQRAIDHALGSLKYALEQSNKTYFTYGRKPRSRKRASSQGASSGARSGAGGF